MLNFTIRLQTKAKSIGYCLNSSSSSIEKESSSMSHRINAKSLQRTDSTGQFHVFVVLKVKSNDSFKVISRDNLPNTLRYGRLSLNQKIIMRDETRSNVEGVVVYIRKFIFFLRHSFHICLAFRS